MRILLCLLVFIFAASGASAQTSSRQRRPAQNSPTKSSPTKTSPKNKTTKKAPVRKASKAPVADWPLLQCKTDLKGIAKAGDEYRTKLLSSARGLTKNRRMDLYLRTSVYSQSLTLWAPDVFWPDIHVSRGTSKGCYVLWGRLKRSLETNDSRGTPKHLQAWNQCVMGMYGNLPAQAQRVNQCVKQGISYIKGRQSK